MSKISQENMNQHTNKVTNLKKELVNMCRNDANDSSGVEYLKKMRITHGRAIHDNAVDIYNNIMKKNKDISDDELIKLSTNASHLHVIHNHIRNCEKINFLRKEGKKISENLLNESDSHISSPSPKKLIVDRTIIQSYNISDNNKVTPIITRQSDNTDLLSLQNIETDTDPNYKFNNSLSINTDDIFEKTEENIMTGGNNNTSVPSLNDDNLTEFVNNITSSEAARFLSDNDNQMNSIKSSNSNKLSAINQQSRSITKPTLVNFWAEWCGWSKKFGPTWEKFKETASIKYPELQIAELNSKNEKIGEIPKKIGVKGFPTLVLYRDGKIYKKSAGSLTLEGIDKFINESMSQ